MTNNLEPLFGWKDAAPTEAHAYLLPALVNQLDWLFPAKKASILDIGCGNGYVSNQTAELGHAVTGIDASLDGIEIARQAFPNVRFIHTSLYDPDFLSQVGQGYDCVVSLEVLEHLMSPRRLFEEGFRALKKGGYLILSTPYHGYLKNLVLSLINGWDNHFAVQREGGHIKFFSMPTLREMAISNGFKPMRLWGVGRLPGLWKSMFLLAKK